jgi:hypothetical protein
MNLILFSAVWGVVMMFSGLFISNKPPKLLRCWALSFYWLVTFLTLTVIWFLTAILMEC